MYTCDSFGETKKNRVRLFIVNLIKNNFKREIQMRQAVYLEVRHNSMEERLFSI